MRLIHAVLSSAAAAFAFGQDPAPVPPAPAPQQSGIPECKEMKTTPSGLQYGVLAKGREEPSPKASDMVDVHYTGWLTDGTKFDSSRDRGTPASFPLGQVIKGWTEGLQLMTPGARFKFVIPSDLAYGDAGRPPQIPGKATLVFDVELLKVVSLPTLPPADAKAQVKSPSGLVYEHKKRGSGPAVNATDGVELRFAFFGTDGTLMDCTERQRGQKISGTVDALPVPFLGEIAKLCKVGDVVRVEVPASVWGGAGQDTVWELEVTAVRPIPPFVPSDPKNLVTTQSGLQYEVVKMGEGRSPAATSLVRAHYTGWTTDGKVFDSSHARGEPTEFALDQVIKGWTEGLQLMKEGSVFQFTIPPELAYGARGGPGGKIGPNATLVFRVELVQVK